MYERDLWAGRADAYERGFAQLTEWTAGPLLDAAGMGRGTRVLDLGTGCSFQLGAGMAAERPVMPEILGRVPGRVGCYGRFHCGSWNHDGLST